MRGMVLGDSFMQGMFIGDDDTPPECLRRDLEDRLETKVSIFNTGHLGYSPEQYYYSLVEFADRFRPQFVVVSVFANDFAGDVSEVAMRGTADWQEGKYWMDKIIQYCRLHGWTYLIVPAPYEQLLLGRRKAGYYPGMLSNVLEETSLDVPRPQRRLHERSSGAGRLEGERARRPAAARSLTCQIGDGHFSALGSKVWAADRRPAGRRFCSTAIRRSRRRSTDGMNLLRGKHQWMFLVASASGCDNAFSSSSNGPSGSNEHSRS